jgi:hypothetical protein
MKLLLALLLLAPIPSFAAATLPHQITQLAVWNSIKPGEKHIFRVYALREVELKNGEKVYVASFNESPNTQVAPLAQVTSRILTPEEVELAAALITKGIQPSDGDYDYSKAHATFCGNSLASESQFGVVGKIRQNGGMGMFGCGSGLSREAAEVVRILKSAVDDKSRKTLAELEKEAKH